MFELHSESRNLFSTWKSLKFAHIKHHYVKTLKANGPYSIVPSKKGVLILNQIYRLWFLIIFTIPSKKPF